MIEYDICTGLRMPEKPPVNTLWTGVEQLSNHIKIVDAENGGRGIVVKGMKQCRYCKWYVKDNFQCTYSHVLLLPDEACEHFELKEQEHE